MSRRFLHALLLGAILQAGIPSALAEAALRIRMGDSIYGKVVLTVVGSKVRLGDSTYTSTIFTLDGNKVREGDSSNGPRHQGLLPAEQLLNTHAQLRPTFLGERELASQIEQGYLADLAADTARFHQAMGEVGVARRAITGRCGPDEHGARVRQKPGRKQRETPISEILWHYILPKNQLNDLKQTVTIREIAKIARK